MIVQIRGGESKGGFLGRRGRAPLRQDHYPTPRRKRGQAFYMEAKRLALDAGTQGAGTESVLNPHAHSRPIPQHISTFGDRTSRPPRGSQPPPEARLRAARAEVVGAQGAGPDLVACLPGLGGHVTEARVS